MRRLVAGSIGSTDTVIGGNTDCNGHQTTSRYTAFAFTHQSDDEHPRDGEVEGEVGLDHCDRPSDRIGRCVSRSCRNQGSSFVVVSKTLIHRHGNPSCSVTAFRPLEFRSLRKPRVCSGTEEIENGGQNEERKSGAGFCSLPLGCSGPGSGGFHRSECTQELDGTDSYTYSGLTREKSLYCWGAKNRG